MRSRPPAAGRAPEEQHRELQRTGCIFLCAFIAVVPLMVRGNSFGHDFDFHLLSWMETAKAWRQGVVYPQWLASANYGAGEPRFVFYPPASWMLGAVLGTLTNWTAAPILFILISLFLSGVSLYHLAIEWMPHQAALLAACVYAVNPYAVFSAYERSAYGELLAGAWIPLIVLFALRRRGSAVSLALAVAAVWLTNAPAAVMACYTLAGLAAAAAIMERKLWPLIRAVCGGALGLGLASFYLAPAAYQRQWVQIARALSPGIRVEDNFLSARADVPDHAAVLRMASWLAVALLASTVVALAYAWKKHGGALRHESHRTDFQRLPAALALITVAVFVLLLPLSEPVWRFAPELRFLQFPWRWLLVQSTVMAVAVGLAAGGIFEAEPQPRQFIRGLALLGLVALMVGAETIAFYQPEDDDDTLANQIRVFHSGAGVEGTDEYTPANADNSAIQKNLPPLRLLTAPDADLADSSSQTNPEYRTNAEQLPAQTGIDRWQAQHRIVHAYAVTPGFAVLRLMDYPAWRVLVNGRALTARPRRPDGLIVVPLPAGASRIEVTWRLTRDGMWGRMASLASLALLLPVAILERPKGKPSGMIDQMQANVREILESGAELADRALERLLPPAGEPPSSIHRAMRHSVFAGGKRLRPVLCLEAARVIAGTGGLPEGVEDLGSAIEMLHTYSLIHDDLPALDNDDLRRGKPTCHVVFGEAIAILAGDALQTQAYETLAGLKCPAAATVEIVRLIAQATGTMEGMIGGQVLDLEGEHHKPTAAMVHAIHRAKTGALIRVSLVAGGIFAGAGGEDVRRLQEFGRKAGLAFQIADDVLDVTQNSEHLGKTAGKDVASEKMTWPAVYGIAKSRQDAAALIAAAFEELAPYGERADGLKAVAQYLVERTH